MDEFLSINCRAASTVQELQPHSFPGLKKIAHAKKLQVESQTLRTAGGREVAHKYIKEVPNESQVHEKRFNLISTMREHLLAHLQVLEPDEAAAKRHHTESAQTLQQTQEERQLQVRKEVQRLRFTHSVVAGAHQTQHLRGGGRVRGQTRSWS